nr:unnamed protein product [Rangifer tarandus platyrhynchus]
MGPSSPWCAGHVDLPRGPPRSLPHAQQGPSPPHPWAPRAPPAHTTSRLSPLLLRSVLRPLRDTGTPLTNEAMEPSSRGITELSVGACRQDGRHWAAGPGGRAGLRSGPDGRGTTGRLVTRHGPSGGCARPPVRGAWPKSVGQPRGAQQRSPSSVSERMPSAPGEPAQCLWPPSGAGASCAPGCLSAASAWWSGPMGAEGRLPVTPR